MQLLDEHLWSLYTQGIVSSDEMIDKSRHPGELQEKLEAYHRRKGTEPGAGEDSADAAH